MKVAISGSHGVGKTTLMRAWGRRHTDWGTLSEVSRSCPFPLNEKATYQTQNYIMHRQIELELDISSPNIKFVSDRSTLDQIAYVRQAHELGNMTNEQAEYLIKHCRAWAGTYDFIFYIPIEFEMENDGVRSPNLDYQRKIDKAVRHEFALLNDGEFSNAAMNALTLTGSVDERLGQMERVLIHKEF